MSGVDASGYSEAKSEPPRKCFQAFYGLQALVAFGGAVALSAIGLIALPPSMETSLDPFMDSSVSTYTMRRGFKAALEVRSGDFQDQMKTMRQTDDGTLVQRFNIYLAYELVGDGGSEGILSVRKLSEIFKLERKLRDLGSWVGLCTTASESSRTLCEPGLSLTNYRLPSRNLELDAFVPKSLSLDGNARQPLPVEVALRLAEQHSVKRLLLPYGYETGTSARILRSVFRFDMPCCKAGVSKDAIDKWQVETKAKWKALLVNDVMPLLQEAVKEKELTGMKLYWSGTHFEEVEVVSALWKDCYFAIGSVAAILLYLVMHTRSPLLAVAGVASIAPALPLAYIAFAGVSGSQDLGLASFICVFLVISLGTDMILLYTDFWNNSMLYQDPADETARVSWTYWNGGKASLTHMLLIALPFILSLMSCLRTLREFGLVFGFCMIFCWILVTLIYVPLLVVEERSCANFRLVSAGTNVADGVHATFRFKTFDLWAGRVARQSGLCIVLPLLVMFILIMISLGVAKTSTDLPTLFPRDHESYVRADFMNQFSEGVSSSTAKSPPRSLPVCNEDKMQSNSEECALFWCDATTRSALASQASDVCQCYRKEQPDCGPGNSTVVQHFVGVSAIHNDQLEGAIGDFLVAGHTAGMSFYDPYNRIANLRSEAIQPMMLQEWLTGQEVSGRTVNVIANMKRTSTSTKPPCGWEDLCFCNHNGFVCTLDSTPVTGWRLLPPIKLPPSTNTSSRRLQETSLLKESEHQLLEMTQQTRRLQQQSILLPLAQQSVPISKQTKIEVAFGLKLPTDSPLLGQLEDQKAWSFSRSFEANDPWAQRDMYSFCQNLPGSLRVVDKQCWIEPFRDFVEARSYRFPVNAHLFDALVLSFRDTVYLQALGEIGAPLQAKEFLWFREGKVKALYMAFLADVSKNTEMAAVATYKKGWDEYVENRNGLSMEVDAFHTSDLWLRVEVQREFVVTQEAILTATVILVNVIALLFSHSLAITLLMDFAAVVVLAMQAFLIGVVANLAIGPMEVAAFTCFAGYAASYTLLVAQRYADDMAVATLMTFEPSEVRRCRVTFALQSMGGLVAGSAVTTMSSAFFALFCSITVFRRLALVLLCAALISSIMSLVVVPALLACMGPTRPAKCEKYIVSQRGPAPVAQPTSYGSGQEYGDGGGGADLSVHPRNDGY
jgi:hypothetical protein